MSRTSWIICATLCLISLIYLVNGDRRECCRHIPNRSKYRQCKDACEQMWMSSGLLQQIEVFSTTYRYCPTENLQNFWQCAETNYPVLTDIERWEGRACCELAYSTDCQLGCQTANRFSDLSKSCAETDESTLYSCARTQAGSIDCCHNINSKQCKAACRAMFVSSDSATSQTLLDNLTEMCTSIDSPVKQCVGNWTRQNAAQTSLPTKSSQCCEQGFSTVCKQTCIQAFSSLTNQNDIIETLIPICGQPDTTDPLWQCFLLSQSSGNRGRPQVTEKSSPMDAASIQCCSRAVSSQCKSLCISLYDSKLSSVWESFSAACQYNTEETAMNECIQNVEEPCDAGCNGLEFCENFNNRFDVMFRSCNKKADFAARTEYNSWLREGSIRILGLSTVPIKDISTCEPDMWKAISCALNLKPCNLNGNKICKSDCIHILSRCVDESKRSYDIGTLCDKLPVSDNEDECISLSQFTESVESESSVDLSNPCLPHPCNETEVCDINRNYPQCKRTHRSCQPFVCRSGCPVGETSPLLIRHNQYAKVVNLQPTRPLDLNCQKICKCSHNGFLTHCEEAYCDLSDSCVLSPDSIKEHGARYNTQCNQCVCHTGGEICSHRFCPKPQQQIDNSFGLPCNCGSSYQPVCTNNGQVLGNPCLAHCSGHGELSYAMGNCASRNPCGVNNCPHGNKCVPERKVCLSSATACPQHRCVPADCNAREHGVVCDSFGMQQPNVCILLARRRQLSYVGRCMSHCAHDSAVCGVNGETYMNECAALADSVAVDYHSPCYSIPNRTGNESACSTVQCNKKIPEWCEKIIPPGACCPVCGSTIRSLYSKSDVDKIVQNSDMPYLTAKDISQHLQHHLDNRHCSVYAYISYESELVTLVLPTTNFPSQDVVQFCNIEAHKIASMIDDKSPILKSDATLSVLLSGTLHSSKILVVQKSNGQLFTASKVILTLLIVLAFDIT